MKNKKPKKEDSSKKKTPLAKKLFKKLGFSKDDTPPQKKLRNFIETSPKSPKEPKQISKIKNAAKRHKRSRSKVDLKKLKKISNPDIHYTLMEVIGEGAFGSVHKAISNKDGSNVAIKITKPVTNKDYNCIEKEINLLKGCESPYVINYIDSFFHEKKIWIVLELAEGGSLSDLMKIRGKTFGESEIAQIIKQVLLGLKYLHGKDIVHRDIKCSNILCTNKGSIKLVDFGLCTELSNTLSRRNSFVGSPYWMAPEVIMASGNEDGSKKETYDRSVDIWSLGITVLELTIGRPPLAKLHPLRAIFLIPSNAPPKFSEPNKWGNEIKEFLKSCLNKDPTKRGTVDELLKHPFLEKYCKKKSTELNFVKKAIAEVEDIFLKYGNREKYYQHLNDELVQQAEQELSDASLADDDDDSYDSDDSTDSESSDDDSYYDSTNKDKFSSIVPIKKETKKEETTPEDEEQEKLKELVGIYTGLEVEQLMQISVQYEQRIKNTQDVLNKLVARKKALIYVIEKKEKEK